MNAHVLATVVVLVFVLHLLFSVVFLFVSVILVQVVVAVAVVLADIVAVSSDFIKPLWCYLRFVARVLVVVVVLADIVAVSMTLLNREGVIFALLHVFLLLLLLFAKYFPLFVLILFALRHDVINH